MFFFTFFWKKFSVAKITSWKVIINSLFVFCCCFSMSLSLRCFLKWISILWNWFLSIIIYSYNFAFIFFLFFFLLAYLIMYVHLVLRKFVTTTRTCSHFQFSHLLFLVFGFVIRIIFWIVSAFRLMQ